MSKVKVTLAGLVKGAQYNAKVGAVSSGCTADRYTVVLEGENGEPGKQLKVKATNINVEVPDLTVKQMKTVLDKSSVSYDGVSEKAALCNLVKDNCTSEFILSALHPPQAPVSQPSPGTMPQMDAELAKQAGDRLGQMSPEQLRQQAQAIKSMNTAQLEGLRRSNPQFANLSDDQIRMSATQMEMLANNPAMMQSTAAQLKTGSVGNLAQGGNQTPDMKAAAEQIKNMDPETLKAQSKMIQEMSPAQLQMLRSQNPQFATMSDDAIKANAKMMAENPDMIRMAQQQGQVPNDMTASQLKAMCQTQLDMVKGNPALAEQMAKANPATASMGADGLMNYLQSMVDMDESQLEQMLEMQKKMGATQPNTVNGVPPNPEEMMKNMSSEEKSNMIKMQQEMLKKNPEMVKEMMKNNPMFKGMPQDQIDKQLDAISSMSPEQLEKLMSVAQKVQSVTAPVASAYRTLDTKLGGNLFSILMVLLAIFVCYIIDRFVYSFA